jgi:hypothetical protein
MHRFSMEIYLPDLKQIEKLFPDGYLVISFGARVLRLWLRIEELIHEALGDGAGAPRNIPSVLRSSSISSQ